MSVVHLYRSVASTRSCNMWSLNSYRSFFAIPAFRSPPPGTTILLTFGAGVLASQVLSTGLGTPVGSPLASNLGWGVGVMLGVAVSGGVSGGHLNPAVTVAMAFVGEKEEGRRKAVWWAH